MEQISHEPQKWSRGQLIGFRFLFLYFLFFIFPFPLYLIPYSSLILQPLSTLGANAVDGVATYFIGSDYSPFVSGNGSGDTTFNYVQLAMMAAMTFVATIIWTLLDRKRNNYKKLQYWWIILLRYCLATIMINYGFAKVFKTQFPFPSIDRLGQSFGESSPMGLLWTFMGYSTAYNVFAGLCEVVGGFLLFFKRTTLLGALIVFAAMSNVVMLNFTYDVPVKLLSMHLLAISLCIMIPDIHRLAKLFLFNRPVESAPLNVVFYDAKTKWAYFIGKGLLISYFLASQVQSGLALQKIYSDAEKTMRSQGMYGEYDVETFILNGDTVPPNEQVTRRWKKLQIGTGSADIQSMDGASMKWKFHSTGRRIVMLSPDLNTFGNFSVKKDSSSVLMEGVLYQDTLKVMLKRKTEIPFPLLNRGFHWVNEFPFN